MVTILAILAALALGAALSALVLARRDRGGEPVASAEERERLIAEAMNRASTELSESAGEQLRKATEHLMKVNEEQRKSEQETAAANYSRRKEEFESLTKPIDEHLKRLQGEVSTLSRERKASDATLQALLGDMKAGLGNLGTQTGTLVKALRQPKTRGEWGEVQLKRCVEIAGMTEHVDFVVQKSLHGDDGLLRPDAIVMLPGGRRVVVDSKVPLDAYLEVLEAEDESSRRGELIRHARQVRDHITKLASKRYQEQFESGETPDFVVCFMPSEAALHAAFEAEPALYDYALEQKILVATPTTLVGLLRTVELGWRQERIAAEAQEIASTAKDLHRRMGVFLGHMAKSGRQLDSAVKAYNSAVASAETRVLPQVRRFQDLGAASGEDLEAPKQIEQTVRQVVAEELAELEAETADRASLGGGQAGPAGQAAGELPAERLESDAA